MGSGTAAREVAAAGVGLLGDSGAAGVTGGSTGGSRRGIFPLSVSNFTPQASLLCCFLLDNRGMVGRR